MTPGTIPPSEETQHHMLNLLKMTQAHVLEMVAVDGRRVVILPP